MSAVRSYPVIAHQKKTSCDLLHEVFSLPFSFFLCGHITSCIRTHNHLRVALLLQMMFAAEPVPSCYRPPKRRTHVIRSMRSFFLPFSFFLCGHITSCIRDSRSFARRFAPSNDVRCGTSSILLSPTKKKASCASRRDAFFLPFPSHLIYHLTSCIRAHDHLRVALLLQMMFAAEPVRSCHRPP